MADRRRILRFARACITAVVIGGVGVLFTVALVDNWSEVQRRGLGFGWQWIVAVLLFASAVLVSGVLWGWIVAALAPGKSVSMREATMVHSGSWLLKYIPGQVGSLVNKVVWGKQAGISRALIVITFIYENVFLQVASIVPSAIILIAGLGGAFVASNWLASLLIALALVPLVAVLVPPAFRAVLSFASRRVLKEALPPEYFLRTGSTAAFLFGFTVPRLLNGIGFVVLASAVTTVTPDRWLAFGAAYVLAGAIGILAVFVPSGLGVREAVIFACLIAAGVAPAEAVVVSLLARLLSTIADVVVAACYAVLRFSPSKDRLA